MFCDEVPNHNLPEHTLKEAEKGFICTLQAELTSSMKEAGELWQYSHCLLLIVRINNGYPEHILFIRTDPGQHKPIEVTNAIFYLKSRASN